jgi:uncharacterized protein
VVKLGQKVMVTVVEVDIPRKRIALSLKIAEPARTKSAKRDMKIQKPAVQTKQEPPANAFQAKLMELKKNFKE